MKPRHRRANGGEGIVAAATRGAAEMALGHLNRHITKRWRKGTFGLGTDYAFTKQLREKRIL
jgi:hypothetical protein